VAKGDKKAAVCFGNRPANIASYVVFAAELRVYAVHHAPWNFYNWFPAAQQILVTTSG